ALLAGLLLGDRTGLPRDLDDGFRRAGVYHVLAVSGFNVALIAAAVWTLASLARAGRRTAAVTAIAVVIGFALVVGPEPSVLRAVVMAVLVLAALLLEREAAVVNSLALAALAILAARPGDLLDPGFQLSFAATAGIVLAPLPRGFLPAALAVSVAAQLAVLPIALAHFNQLSTIGVLANLGVVPLAGAATVLGLAAVALGWASEAAAAVAFDAAWPVLLGLRGLVALAARVPGAVVHLPAPPWAASAAYAAALGLALAWHHLRGAKPRGARAAGAGALALLLAALGAAAWPLVRPPDGVLRVTVLDVGQGDAVVVETPDGRTLLIDAGSGGPGRLDAGERVVAPFLWNRGILQLAATAVTHLDADHAGGMPAVHRLLGVPRRLTAESLAPEPYTAGGAVLSLVRPRAGPQAGRNDESLVLRLEYGLASFLLASDVEAAREAELLAAGGPLAATVLKVAHHGARTSSTAGFLRAVGPTVAVISVGARNVYGHPDPGVLARLDAAGARVLRTDRDGAVVFETDGRTLAVTRWAARATERFCLDPETIC
ncbi:MAG: DNA internalization-related competence protein ComEC/Rec2, partial [Candidatus Rokubacteria bacterium]|nr:DNA internalization-related competence protein ComEC/Rec2 [Candidatus Rokubacteria bacterium]